MKLDICSFINKTNEFIYRGNENVEFIGKINHLIINNKYKRLNLYHIQCEKLTYKNQHVYIDDSFGDESISNHILPKNLKILDCSYNRFLKLPNRLPNELKELYCNDCNIINLPELPNKLITLECSYNSISKLPKLPDSLQELLCNHNKLIEFPNIPKSLSVLHISDNKIDGINDYIFDSNIKILNLSNNNIDSIIGVPNKCKYLYCENLPLIKYGLIPNDVKVFHSIHMIERDFLVNDGDISKMIITINDKENCDYDTNYFPKFKRVN